MTTTNKVGGRRRRRTALGAGAGAAALLIAFASVAYACTLLIGTFTVCRPGTIDGEFAGGPLSTQCGQRALTAAQVGSPSYATSGSTISIKARGFSTSGGTVYSLTFAATGGANCHAYNPSAGVTSLLGTVDHDGDPATPEIPRTVAGPDFVVGIGAPGSTGGYNTITTPVVPAGNYTVCSQDEPQRVDGNFIRGVVL